jgi:membrane protease YdiL (CAAX protease family)
MDDAFIHPEKGAERKTSRLTNWLVNFEIPLFFILTFVYSWTLYLCISQSGIHNGAVMNRWLYIAAFGPTLAAMFVARFTDPKRANPKPAQQIALFIVVFIIAFGIEWLDHRWWYHPMSTPLIVADIILVSIVAFVISSVLSSRRGPRNLLRGLTQWRIGFGWYILALVFWPALVMAANALALLFDLGVPVTPYHPTRIPIVTLTIETFFWYILFNGPLNEEPGWRAFGIARLQQHRFSPLIASVIVGAMWGLWHLPVHLMGLFPLGLQGAIIRIFSIPLAIIFTWLFNRTRQSLLPVMILHATINTTSLFLARNYITSSILLTLVAVVLVFLDKMWQLSPHAKNALTSSTDSIQART